MILHQTTVSQTIVGPERERFIKELCVVRGRCSTGMEIPLAMVRKRRAGAESTLASVLLIHGYGQNRYAFHLPARSLSCYLARAGFDVFNLDLRGHGRSKHLGARRPHDVSEFVTQDVPWAIREIEELTGQRGVFLVGHSLGGLVSYAAATVAPKSVRGVISLGSPYHFTRGSLSLTLAGHVLLAVDKHVSFGHGALGLRGFGESMRLLRVFVESPLFPSPIRGFLPGSMDPIVLSQHMALAMDNGSITVLRNMFLAAAEANESGHRLGGLSGFAEAFEATNLPLLIIAGKDDDLAPPESVMPAYESSRARDKTYRAFPQGHIDLIMGNRAVTTIWPLIEQWIAARALR